MFMHNLGSGQGFHVICKSTVGFMNADHITLGQDTNRSIEADAHDATYLLSTKSTVTTMQFREMREFAFVNGGILARNEMSMV